MNPSVYINATGAFFPHAAVNNEAMERVLGMVRGKPSRAKNIILASNQIRQRHYAIDPITREPSHSNAQLTAEAVRQLFKNHPEFSLKDAEILCCGTSSPDLIVPAHGQMVQGELAEFTGEVFTTAGVCCSSMSALKIAYLSIRAGEAKTALVTGSEVASKFMRGEFLEAESESQFRELQKNPLVAFEHDFLRWMLSDGASAVYVSDRVQPGRVNLRLNWIEGRSYANEQAVCMFAGGVREADRQIKPWKDVSLEPESPRQNFVMNFRQDIRQLREVVTHFTVERPLTELKKKRGLRPGDYDWFLPHFSSHFFRPVLAQALDQVDFHIPEERWFTALYDKGNVGSASMFVFLDELLRQKQLARGQKILCYVPESARFSVYYFELEVV